MKAIKALLVDMDGTLVDTATANYEAYAAALRAVGISVARGPFDEVAQGRNWRQFLPAMLGAGASSVDPAAVAAHKAEIYPSKIPLTQVNRALVALVDSGRASWRTALVTTASRANAATVLHYHQLEGLFDTIVTGDDVARHKPDPEGYQIAAARLSVSPDECLVIEDSDAGVASARAFGAPCLRITYSSDAAAE